MIRHIVVWKLRATDTTERESILLAMKEKLEALVAAHPGITSIDVYKSMALVEWHWDVVLVADYESQEALDAYQVYPDHKAFVTWVEDYSAQRIAIDYLV